jgi:hypothetical protein
MSDDFTVRCATVADLAVILRHRRAMFEAMGHRDSEALDAMVASSRAHMRQTLEDGSYRGWLAETPVGDVAGGGGIVITLWPSHPLDAGSLALSSLTHAKLGIGRTVSTECT